MVNVTMLPASKPWLCSSAFGMAKMTLPYLSMVLTVVETKRMAIQRASMGCFCIVLPLYGQRNYSSKVSSRAILNGLSALTECLPFLAKRNCSPALIGYSFPS